MGRRSLLQAPGHFMGWGEGGEGGEMGFGAGDNSGRLLKTLELWNL